MAKKAKQKAKSRSAGPVDKYIGAQMRRRRIALGMSLAELAEKLGIAYQQVQKYKIGENRVSSARLFDVCEALEVSLASMFERKLP